MPSKLLTLAALLLGGLPACGDGASPQSSSSSHWLSCDTDEDCSNLPMKASCGRAGYCVDASGREIEAHPALDASFEASALDESVFGFETGSGLRNGDLQTYTARSENAFLQGGELVLVALADGGSYSSASIETRGKAAFLYGRIEAELKAPGGSGVDPSFWMLPERPGAAARVCDDEACTESAWPVWGDVVIASLRSEPDVALHGVSYASGAKEPLAPAHDGARSVLPTTADGYHTYRLDWGPARMDWFVDGARVHRVDLGDPAIHRPDGENPFHREFHLKLSLAVGGLAAAPVAQDFPHEMRVRSLRVTQYE